MRIRVASSDWCASRMVVSVTSTPVRPSIQAATASGPCASSSAFAPGAGLSTWSRGGEGLRAWAGGLGRPVTSGWPLTVVSAM